MDIVAKFNETIDNIYSRIEYALQSPPDTDRAPHYCAAHERIVFLRLLALRMPEEMQTELTRVKYSSHADLTAMIDSLEEKLIDLENGGGRGMETIPIDLGYDSGNEYPLLPEDE